MNTAVYDKEYFEDNYKAQFEALRNRFHDRTQQALAGRKIDKNPMPNATTIVFLHDEPDGGVRISTGDFVEYFNQRYGDTNRLGAMRKSLAIAERKADMSNEYAKRQRSERARRTTGSVLSEHVRSTKRPLLFVHAVFAVMLICSLFLLGVSGALLDREEVVTVEATESVTVYNTDTASNAVSDAYLDRSATNTAYAYEVVEEKDDGFFASLWRALGFAD